jgi:hypothetical protein
MLSFEQFLTKVDKAYNDHPFELRYGQTVMNTLYEVWPEKHKQIVGSEYDCFYDDGTVRFTLDYLERVWNDPTAK